MRSLTQKDLAVLSEQLVAYAEETGRRGNVGSATKSVVVLLSCPVSAVAGNPKVEKCGLVQRGEFWGAK